MNDGCAIFMVCFGAIVILAHLDFYRRRKAREH